MNQTIQGIILNTIRYKDNSYICRIYTENFGMKAFLIQSGKTAKTSKTNLLQPLMPVEFEASIKENVQIQRLKDLRVAIVLTEVYYNPVKSAMVLFLDEILFKTIPDDYINPRLYKFLWQSIQLLDDAIDERNFHLWCLLEISRHYGFHPYIEDENAEYFDMETAAFTSKRPLHPHYIDGLNCKALIDILDNEWLQVQPYQLHSSIRKTLLESLVKFLKLHLDNLREIKSLQVLHEVFH